MEIMEAPILITGCARSGTSMTAGIIDHHGAYGGKTIGGGPANPKGFFENREIRENILKPYMQLCGGDPKGQKPLPQINNLIKVTNLGFKIEQIIKYNGYHNGPWYYKGAKMCLVWPTFHVHFPKAKWVIVRREDEDIINSCMNTGFMSAYKCAEGWQEWIDVHKLRFSEMHENGLQIKEVWPSKFVKGDYSEIKETIEWLGMKFNEEIVKDMVVPNKFRQAKESV